MKILVYGLGAIGITFATFLKESGNIVFGKVKEKNFPRKLYVNGIWGKHSAELDKISSDILDFKNEEIDLIILSVKAYNTEEALKDIKQIIRNDTILLLTQNGYGNYELAVKYIGKERTLLSRVIFGAKVVEKGKVNITVNADDVIIGQPDRAIPEDKIKAIVNIIRKSGIPASYSPDVYKILWDKIIYNCALNPLGAILGCSYGDLADNEYTKKIMSKIVEEIFKITKAYKIELNWENPQDYLNFFYKELIPPTREHYPSMFYDIQTGKRTEIDALNGAIVKLAKAKNLETPTNELITNLIKFKEKINRG
ncbi:MAG: 2-dehydropantoate 2-reductase [Persephonella sp.]|nr:MAG: 2-dehydropantoate 2-reductase [Persephonella sp.]RUM61587.1 MAG: 2-dehydropantoate 2-reductase [Persephonella sp.]